MYNSPVKIMECISDDVLQASEDIIMNTIRLYVDVNRDELVKALQYDRNQYNKGFMDGRLSAIDEILYKIGRVSATLEYEVRKMLDGKIAEFRVLEEETDNV